MCQLFSSTDTKILEFIRIAVGGALCDWPRSPWPGSCVNPTLQTLSGAFSLKRARFSQQNRAADAAPRLVHVTSRSGLSSPARSVFPSQGSMSALWPHPVSLQGCLSPQCRLLFSERESEREREKIISSKNWLFLSFTFHDQRPGGERPSRWECAATTTSRPIFCECKCTCSLKPVAYLPTSDSKGIYIYISISLRMFV